MVQGLDTRKEFITYIIIQGEYTKDGKNIYKDMHNLIVEKIKYNKEYFKDPTLHIEQTRGTPEQASEYCKQRKER